MSDSPTQPSVAEGFAAWRTMVERELGAEDFDRVLRADLPGGITVDALTSDIEARPDAAGFPGLGCHVRGGTPLGPDEGTDTSPLRDEPLARDLNAALLEDFENGASAAHIVLDRGARLGSAGPQEQADARGLLLGSAETLNAALEGVLLDAVSLSVDAGANARPLWTLLRTNKQDAQFGALQLGQAPLAALARDGCLPGSLESAWDDGAALIAETSAFPAVIPLALDARPWHEAGADMAVELGLLLAEGAELLRAMEARDLAPEVLAQNLVLRLALDPDVFASIALLRAARLCWTQMLRNSGVAQLPPTRVHAFEGARSLSKRDPWVNILRTTTQAFAAQTAGADAFTPLSYDRALGAPGRLGRRVARNTPSILNLEGHIGRVLDPAGGSGYVEALTDALARRAWTILREVEGQGGLAAGLLDGRVQGRIESSLAARRERILAGEPGLVGVALYPPDEVAITAVAPNTELLGRDQGQPCQLTAPSDSAAALRAAQAGADLACLSQALGRGAAAECAALVRVRDAAPFEEEGVPPLTATRKGASQ